jgi:glycosyltransferase involved in cell wall biosynthesis
VCANEKEVVVVRLDSNVGVSQVADGTLVVLSHLRWNWVWQRPQHIVSRLAAQFERTVFVEEPVSDPSVTRTRLRTEECGSVERVWLEVQGEAGHCGFLDDRASDYGELLAERFPTAPAVSWLYTPLALPIATAIQANTIVFDVMDDLSAFAHASPQMRFMHRTALASADVVFAGGHSLHRAVSEHRSDVLCFPSGVELEHYGRSIPQRPATRRRPVAGYVGVLDERLDLELLHTLATQLHDWDVHMVGPVTKIDPSTLPAAPNLRYLGAQPYARLPEVMAGFDVALMPFALNESTRSISPTKSLEYLAAGLPVVSTRVPDVVADLGDIVELADDGLQFAAACRRLASSATPPETEVAIRALLRWNQWDTIVDRMMSELKSAQQNPIERAAL